MSRCQGFRQASRLRGVKSPISCAGPRKAVIEKQKLYGKNKERGMLSGRDLDKEIAIKVFHRRWDTREFNRGGAIEETIFFADPGVEKDELPHYHRDQDAAITIVRELEKRDGGIYERFVALCESYTAQKATSGAAHASDLWCLVPPAEICRAALKALDARG